MPVVSISKAAKLVRKGRQTLYNHNDKGKLSFTRTEDGKPGIDTSELERVYGKLYMPANNAETLRQADSGHHKTGVDKLGQGVLGSVGAESAVSNTVSMDERTVSTLSWFMEQVDEVKEELTETQTLLAEREKTLAELREALASLPSPESVEQRLIEQAEKLKQQHNQALEAERTQRVKLLAEQKQREAKQSEQWQQSIAERQKEIRQAREEAEALKERAYEQVEALRRERKQVAALESRGFIARLLNRKPVVAE